MKKSLIYAAILAAGFMTSCSNDDKSFDTVNNDADKLPILFTMNNGAVSVTTRGSGAVGDVAGSSNVWRSEKLYVSMFDHGTLNHTEDAELLEGVIFKNTVLTAPASTAAANTGVAEYEGYKYYPQKGNFDFFAYHISDAADPNNVTPEGTLDVTIDGSQDLMVAKADMTEDQRTTWESALDAEYSADASNYYNRYYSAFSARRNVQPHFQFKHLLSRFVFNVTPSENAKDKVTVNAIKILNAKTKATMVVAYTQEPAALLTPDDNSADTVSLKELVYGQTEAYALQELTAKTYSATSRVGESLLLMPQDEYELLIEMSQETPESVVYKFTYPYTITPGSAGVAAFEAGKQYNVNFTIYGIEEIKIDITLTPWTVGGDITIDNDDVN